MLETALGTMRGSYQMIADDGTHFDAMIPAFVLTIPLGITYGPQAALYAEMFPAKVRYSGVSVGYALGSILGGAFAATIAQWIISAYGQSWLIGVGFVVFGGPLLGRHVHEMRRRRR